MTLPELYVCMADALRNQAADYERRGNHDYAQTLRERAQQHLRSALELPAEGRA